MSSISASLRFAAALVGALALSSAFGARAQDDLKTKGAAAPDKASDASRYCAAAAPSIVEARIAWQTKRLNELDAAIKQRLAELQKTEAATREWVEKRDALLKSASDDVVAIYSKMPAESAASQISAMDDAVAAAILAKLKPQAAGAIFDQMEASRASKLAAILSGLAPEEKKS